jgi:hypothetical protein
VQEAAHQDAPPGLVPVKQQPLGNERKTDHSEEHVRMLKFTEEKAAQESEDWVAGQPLDDGVMKVLMWCKNLTVE